MQFGAALAFGRISELYTPDAGGQLPLLTRRALNCPALAAYGR